MCSKSILDRGHAYDIQLHTMLLMPYVKIALWFLPRPGAEQKLGCGIYMYFEASFFWNSFMKSSACG
jgi:hypothetical protein